MHLLSRLKNAATTSLCLAFALAVSPAGHAAELEKVTYLLPAPAFLTGFAPWTLAKAHGYYEQEGLDVTFVSASGGADVAKQVGAGNAAIGGASGDTPMIVRANGIPVKAVAVMGGGSLGYLVVHADSAIQGPADLRGKTISVQSYQDTTYYGLLGMLATAGLTKNDVKAQAAGPAGVWKLFSSRESEAMISQSDSIVYAMEAGAKVRYYSISSYFPNMAQAIIASDKMIQERPDLIRKLVRATLRGLQDIMADRKAAARDFVKAYPQHAGKEDQVEKIMALYVTNVYAGQPVLGQMDVDKLTQLQDFYVKEGILKQKRPVSDFYTNQFVQ